MAIFLCFSQDLCHRQLFETNWEAWLHKWCRHHDISQLLPEWKQLWPYCRLWQAHTAMKCHLFIRNKLLWVLTHRPGGTLQPDMGNPSLAYDNDQNLIFTYTAAILDEMKSHAYLKAFLMTDKRPHTLSRLYLAGLEALNSKAPYIFLLAYLSATGWCLKYCCAQAWFGGVRWHPQLQIANTRTHRDVWARID